MRKYLEKNVHPDCLKTWADPLEAFLLAAESPFSMLPNLSKKFDPIAAAETVINTFEDVKCASVHVLMDNELETLKKDLDDDDDYRKAMEVMLSDVMVRRLLRKMFKLTSGILPKKRDEQFSQTFAGFLNSVEKSYRRSVQSIIPLPKGMISDLWKENSPTDLREESAYFQTISPIILALTGYVSACLDGDNDLIDILGNWLYVFATVIPLGVRKKPPYDWVFYRSF